MMYISHESAVVFLSQKAQQWFFYEMTIYGVVIQIVKFHLLRNIFAKREVKIFRKTS